MNGSVADKICRSSTIPIVAVPAIGEGKSPGPGPVVVGLDGSHSALVALTTARTLADELDSKIILLRACTTPVIAGPEYVNYPPSAFTDVEDAARTYLAEIARPDSSPPAFGTNLVSPAPGAAASSPPRPSCSSSTTRQAAS